MFPGMSERNFKEHVLDSSAKDMKDIEDWMHGDGGKVLGVILVLLGLWTVIRFFWS